MEATVNDQSTSLSTETLPEPLFDLDLDRKYMCPVCLCVLKEPVQTSCGHRFCKACIRGTFDLPTYVCSQVRNNIRVPFSRCPVDNTYFHIEKELFSDNAIKREVLSLNVRCPNIQNECGWNGELRNYSEHERQCMYKVISCENGCGVRVIRKDMSHHQEECSLRIVFCPHCQKQMAHNIMSKHEVLVCQNFPVQCLQCGQVGIKRKDIGSHMSKETGDCPITIIDCPFKVYGCQVTTTRLCMASHLEDSCHTHLSYVMDHVLTQDRHIAELVNEVTNIRQVLLQQREQQLSIDEFPGTADDTNVV
ncbi:TNF receptor-associated factor 6-B-like isoform X2 [Pecten maximus]|uniref:TNF receptor-associated factor 6-B-like isoform X2 n=1 Tax=Pecten maximus TaxID=6579 RepID=UPI0014581305|nr:TNF receptor-associated factor 6-B-like isoform X2 [Pecten maximus]